MDIHNTSSACNWMDIQPIRGTKALWLVVWLLIQPICVHVCIYAHQRIIARYTAAVAWDGFYPANFAVNGFNPRPTWEVKSFARWIMGLVNQAREYDRALCPTKHMLVISKENIAFCLSAENHEFYQKIKNKNLLSDDARSPRPMSFAANVAQLDSKASLFSAEPFQLCLSEGSLHWVRAGECGGGSALSRNLIQCVGSSR